MQVHPGGRGPYLSRDAGSSATEGLGENDPKRLGPVGARQDERSSVAVLAIELGFSKITCEDNTVAKPQRVTQLRELSEERPRSDDPQIQPLCQCECAEQHWQTLVAAKAPYKEERRRFARHRGGRRSVSNTIR